MPKLETTCSREGSDDRVGGVYFFEDHDCIDRLGLDIELNFDQPTDYWWDRWFLACPVRTVPLEIFRSQSSNPIVKIGQLIYEGKKQIKT